MKKYTLKTIGIRLLVAVLVALLTTILIGSVLLWQQNSKYKYYRELNVVASNVCTSVPKTEIFKYWSDQSLFKKYIGLTDKEVAEIDLMIASLCVPNKEPSFWEVDDVMVSDLELQTSDLKFFVAKLREDAALKHNSAKFSYAYWQMKYLADVTDLFFNQVIPGSDSKLYKIAHEIKGLVEGDWKQLIEKPKVNSKELSNALVIMDKLRESFIEFFPEYARKLPNSDYAIKFVIPAIKQLNEPHANENNYGRFPPLLPEKQVDLNIETVDITSGRIPFGIFGGSPRYVSNDNENFFIEYMIKIDGNPRLVPHEIRLISDKEFSELVFSPEDFRFTTDPNSFCLVMSKSCFTMTKDHRIWRISNYFNLGAEPMIEILSNIK